MDVEPWQALPQREDGSKQVSLLRYPSQHIGRFKVKRLGVTLAQCRLKLLPRDWGRNSRMRSRPQAIGAARGLVLVVLAPVDEDLAHPQVLAHGRHHVLRILLLDKLREGAGEGLGVVVAAGGVQRDVK